MHPALKSLIESGIPLKQLILHQAVNNANNVPNDHYSHDSQNVERRAKMLLTSSGLIVCEQNGRYFFTDRANMISSKPTDEAVDGFEAIGMEPVKRGPGRPAK